MPASRFWMWVSWPRRASAQWSWDAFVMLPARRDDEKRRQLALAGRPGTGGVFEAASAACLEITGGRHAQVCADQPQHLLVLGCQVLEPGPDRYTGRTGHDERLPQPPSTRPPPQGSLSPPPTNTTRKGHAFDT
jgi:hypothetical protein